MENSIEHYSKEYYELQSEYWFNENTKHMRERDDYKKQRDELINDIADIKRKAEAFDEVLGCAGGNAIDVGDEVNKIVEDYYRERGSDE